MSLLSANGTDIQSDNWIGRYLPLSLRAYARLMRLDRPIGTWLLLIPCLWSVAMASPAGWLDFWPMLLFTLGAIVMRGAGCVVNDIYDRNLDAMVERTRTRPLASGEIKLWQAVLFLIVLLILGLGVLLQFNRFTVSIGLSSFLLVAIYPLMKRITWWPQLVLGITFNWGALMGWSAITGKLGISAMLIYGAGIFWTLGYDTIYAHQDKNDDIEIGIKSTALLLGERSRPWIALFYLCALILLALAGYINDLGQIYYYLLVAAALHAMWQLALWRMDNPENCLQRFCSNRDFGLIVLVAILVGKLI